MQSRVMAGAFEQRLLIFAQKQTFPVGLVYLPVQRVYWRG